MTGACIKGDLCACVGDLPSIREGCSSWKAWPSIDMQQENHDLGKRIEELEALCYDAGLFYARGGTFPVDGEMSIRLRKAAGK